MVTRTVDLSLNEEDKVDKTILDYFDNDLPRGAREEAVKRALYRYIKARKRNNASTA